MTLSIWNFSNKFFFFNLLKVIIKLFVRSHNIKGWALVRAYEEGSVRSKQPTRIVRVRNRKLFYAMQVTFVSQSHTLVFQFYLLIKMTMVKYFGTPFFSIINCTMYTQATSNLNIVKFFFRFDFTKLTNYEIHNDMHCAYIIIIISKTNESSKKKRNVGE